MPTYQYACTACGDNIEAVQSFADAALTECAACGGTLRKVFSAVGVVFKGSGFYKTDSRTASKQKKAETSTPTSESKSGIKSESASKGDAKPAAAKAESKSATSSPAA